MDYKDVFVGVSQKIAKGTGSPVTFISAVAVILVWAACGPIFGYSDTWQLIINTSTTIITFLMVFLIQSTQNRDSSAIHLKLDELIRATDGAHLALLNLEELEEHEFQAFRDLYNKIAHKAQEQLDRGESDINCPEIEMPKLHIAKK